MNRLENLSQLENEEFDLVIIGGGASGAGCALDASLRGMKVALIEKEDFSAETSSKSTKLIHGGVRYLEQAFKKLDFGQLKQVKHGLEERHIVLTIAPHLAHPLGLITPVFSWIEGLYYSIGLKLYGFFAKKDTLPKARWLSKKETFQRIPTISEKMHSSVLYYDGQLDDARFCFALAHTADDVGAATLNHAEVVSFQKNEEGKIEAAEVLDKVSGKKLKVKSKVFLNCTGPFADSIRQMANPEEEARMRPSKGVHLMVSSEFMPSKDAMLIPKTKDGRVVFVIPFEGKVMVGTTDEAYNMLEKEPVLESDEVSFLLETMERFFSKVPARADVISGFGGLRPLLAPKKNNKKDTKSLLRDHEVEVDEQSGLISLLGGKWTTYRLMAQDAIDEVARKIKNDSKCRTSSYKLVGSQNKNFESTGCKRRGENYGLSEASITHLLSKYGDRIEDVLEVLKEKDEYLELLHPSYPYIEAEIVYAIREEMAIMLRDFYARRIRFELCDWRAVLTTLDRAGEIYAEELGWTVVEKEIAITTYREQLHEFMNRAGLSN